MVASPAPPPRALAIDWYFIAKRTAPPSHLAYLEGCAALRIMLVTASRVSRSCENFLDGFDLHLLHQSAPATPIFQISTKLPFSVAVVCKLELAGIQ